MYSLQFVMGLQSKFSTIKKQTVVRLRRTTERILQSVRLTDLQKTLYKKRNQNSINWIPWLTAFE